MYILCDLKGQCLNDDPVVYEYMTMRAECSKLRQPMRAIFALSRAQLLLLRACLITLHSNFEIFLKEHPAVDIKLDRCIFER